MVMSVQDLGAIQKSRKIVITKEDNVDNELSVEKMERAFNFHKVKPIIPSVSDEKDMIEKGDCFKDWYEEELRELYDTYKR